jgi:O-antigen biosynthesis protein WbqV
LRISKSQLAFMHDIVMASLCLGLAMVIRVGDLAFGHYAPVVLYGTPVFVLIAAASFRAVGMYRGIWRYASIADLMAIAKAVTLAILVFVFAAMLVNRFEAMPRSVPIIQWLLLIFLLGAPRVAYRLFKDARLSRLVSSQRDDCIPVLLLGAGDASELFIRATANDYRASYRAVGIIDETGRRIGRAIHGVPVLGLTPELPHLVRRLAQRGQYPQKLVITDPALVGSAERLGTLINLAEGSGLSVARLPSLTEFKTAVNDGRVDLHPIALEDLLGRPQARLDLDAMRALIAGKRVLVTGAGGTIGSELVRQIAAFDPAALILSDNGEYNLYAIDLAVAEICPALPRQAVLCDVRDRERVRALCVDCRPDLVFHVAALKHVPLVETNPGEGILTNAIGTRNVADAALACDAIAMVEISTDKAVNPTGIMGASKRLAEYYCQALDLADDGYRSGARTRFITVRFGNVLGSSGSVVPLFQRQLAAGGPLTVTHPDIKRYFMTVREAVGLVLHASAYGVHQPDQRGRIFVLDMGEPIRIVDIARQVIRLSGLRPDTDVPIRFVGLRPGEKLVEELFDATEMPIETAADGVLGAMPRPINLHLLQRVFDELEQMARRGDSDALRNLVSRVVPGFTPAPALAPPADSKGLALLVPKDDHPTPPTRRDGKI